MGLFIYQAKDGRVFIRSITYILTYILTIFFGFVGFNTLIYSVLLFMNGLDGALTHGLEGIAVVIMSGFAPMTLRYIASLLRENNELVQTLELTKQNVQYWSSRYYNEHKEFRVRTLLQGNDRIQ